MDAKAAALHDLWRPISEMPVKAGEPYGDCLYRPGRGGRPWGLGEWDGKRHIDYDHGPLTPTDYIFLGRSEA